MAEKQTDEQKAAEAQRKAEAEALAADPIGGKPPIDVAHERAAEEGEPLGYVDPESQKVPEGYAPDPDGDTTPKTSARKAAVTRDDASKE